MCDIPNELIINLYEINPFIIPINKETRNYLQNKRNYAASLIQKWYKRNKIGPNMPILFMDEITNFSKWYIIRLYMKFYPKEDLLEWPMHCTRKVKQTRKYDNEILLSINKAYQVFEFMKKQTKRNIISTGF